MINLNPHYSWIEHRHTWVICTLAYVSSEARTSFPQVLLLPPAAKWHQRTPGYAQTPTSARRMRNGVQCQRHCSYVGQEIFLLTALYFWWGVKQKSAHACSLPAARRLLNNSVTSPQRKLCWPAACSSQLLLLGNEVWSATDFQGPLWHQLFCIPVASSSSLTLQQPKLIIIFI